MKICIINNLYKPWERGGAERIVQSEVNGLSSLGHDVFVLATAPEETKADDVYFLRSDFYNSAKYPLHIRFLWHILGLFPSQRVSRAMETIDRERPDLVITHNLVGMGLYLSRAIHGRGYRHFHILHDIQLLHPSGLMMWGEEARVDSWLAKIYQYLAKRLLGSPEVVISPSAWLLGEHKKRGFFPSSKMVVIPNFFPLPKIEEEVDVPDRLSPKFRFLFVGQMERHKGVELLLDAWSSLDASCRSNAELCLVGDGALLKELKGRFSSQVEFLGKKSQEDVEELMSQSDLLLVPSLCYENSPTVIYEAIASKLPILAADIGGIGELAKAAGGELFKPGDAKDLARKMTELCSSPSRLEHMKGLESSFAAPGHVASLEALARSADKG